MRLTRPSEAVLRGIADMPGVRYGYWPRPETDALIRRGLVVRMGSAVFATDAGRAVLAQSVAA